MTGTRNSEKFAFFENFAALQVFRPVRIEDPLIEAMAETVKGAARRPIDPLNAVAALAGKYPLKLVEPRLDAVLKLARAA